MCEHNILRVLSVLDADARCWFRKAATLHALCVRLRSAMTDQGLCACQDTAKALGGIGLLPTFVLNPGAGTGRRLAKKEMWMGGHKVGR